jgi:hypothetical protein
MNWFTTRLHTVWTYTGGGLPCRTCGRRCVGYSVYCRAHTDEIIEVEVIRRAHLETSVRLLDGGSTDAE